MYQSPYAQPWQGKALGGPQVRDPRGRRGAETGSSLLRMLGLAAPIAGTAIGAGVGSMAGGIGAAPGAAIGGALGGAAGQLAGFGADQVMKPYDEAQAKRIARQQQIDAILNELRATR